MIEVRALVAKISFLCDLALRALGETTAAAKPGKTGTGDGTKLPADTKPAATGDGNKLADVVAVIEKILRATGGDKTKAVKSSAIMEKLEDKFPDRETAWLKDKLNVQLSGALKRKFKLDCKKTSDGKWYAVAVDK